jgi:hypothetical protein
VLPLVVITYLAVYWFRIPQRPAGRDSRSEMDCIGDVDLNGRKTL